MTSIVSLAQIQEKTPLKLLARVQLSSIESVFEGHFPTQTILPGVIQLAWVRELISFWWAEDVHFQSLPQLKFMTPLLPEHTVEIELSLPTEAERKVAFSYYIVKPTGERILASQGKGLL